MIYGYCRISTKKQNIDRQIRNIKRRFPDAIIYQESYTGTKVDGRKEFERLLSRVTKGDTIVFDEVSRMSRNAEEGFSLYEKLFNDGIRLVFLKEPHIDTDSYREAMQGIISSDISSGDKSTDDLVNSILAAVKRFMLNKVRQDIFSVFKQAQAESDYLRQRTKEGLETARLNGKHIGIEQGTKLITKKSVAAKEIIKKHNKAFGGSLSNEETWTLAKISEMTFYKYKRDLISELE